MEHRKLLIGTWELTHIYDLIDGEWIRFDYPETCTYTFTEDSFIVRGHGYHEENESISYFLHPEHNVLQAPANIAFVNHLSENELELEESLWLTAHSVNRIRLVFKKTGK